jgi:hypothetical protein
MRRHILLFYLKALLLLIGLWNAILALARGADAALIAGVILVAFAALQALTFSKRPRGGAEGAHPQRLPRLLGGAYVAYGCAVLAATYFALANTNPLHDQVSPSVAALGMLGFLVLSALHFRRQH